MLEQLIMRIEAEQEDYLKYIAKLSPESIIEKAYEICFREEIASILTATQFTDETIEKLMELDNIVKAIYEEWLATDCNMFGPIEELIADFCKGV